MAMTEDLHYPASVVGYPHMGDHVPLMLSPPCDSEDTMGARRRLRLGGLSEADWAQKDAQIGEVLHQLDPTNKQPMPRRNIGRHHSRLMQLIIEVFQDELRRPSRPNEGDPLDIFLRPTDRHDRHACDRPTFLRPSNEGDASTRPTSRNGLPADGYRAGG